MDNEWIVIIAVVCYIRDKQSRMMAMRSYTGTVPVWCYLFEKGALPKRILMEPWNDDNSKRHLDKTDKDTMVSSNNNSIVSVYETKPRTSDEGDGVVWCESLRVITNNTKSIVTRRSYGQDCTDIRPDTFVNIGMIKPNEIRQWLSNEKILLTG